MRISAIRGIVAAALAWAALTTAAFGQSKLDAGVEQTLSEIENARVLVSSGQGEPVAGESSLEHVASASFERSAGARRIIIQGGAGAMKMRADELAERISRALGSHATVRSLGAGTYLAESRAGFSVESLSKLMAALGSDTKLYRDEPVGPTSARR